jgi:hypothetical protein
MLYIIVTSAWIVAVIVSWIYENRKMPVAIGILGTIAQIGIWFFGFGFLGVAALALLTVICMFSVSEVFFGGRA